MHIATPCCYGHGDGLSSQRPLPFQKTFDHRHRGAGDPLVPVVQHFAAPVISREIARRSRAM